MPRIKWLDLPPELRRYLFDRDPWYKDFGSFKLCGEGQYPKTFLLKGQTARGKEIE